MYRYVSVESPWKQVNESKSMNLGDELKSEGETLSVEDKRQPELASNTKVPPTMPTESHPSRSDGPRIQFKESGGSQRPVAVVTPFARSLPASPNIVLTGSSARMRVTPSQMKTSAEAEFHQPGSSVQPLTSSNGLMTPASGSSRAIALQTSSIERNADGDAGAKRYAAFKKDEAVSDELPPRSALVPRNDLPPAAVSMDVVPSKTDLSVATSTGVIPSGVVASCRLCDRRNRKVWREAGAILLRNRLLRSMDDSVGRVTVCDSFDFDSQSPRNVSVVSRHTKVNLVENSSSEGHSAEDHANEYHSDESHSVQSHSARDDTTERRSIGGHELKNHIGLLEGRSMELDSLEGHLMGNGSPGSRSAEIISHKCSSRAHLGGSHLEGFTEETTEAFDVRMDYLELMRSNFFYPNLTRPEAKARLRSTSVGTFLVRPSSDAKFQFALSIKTANGVTSVRLTRNHQGLVQLDCDPRQSRSIPTFRSVLSLVETYVRDGEEEKDITPGSQCIYLERAGQTKTELRLGRPLEESPAALGHLCRKRINASLFRSKAFGVADLVENLPDLEDIHREVIARYLEEYPYKI